MKYIAHYQLYLKAVKPIVKTFINRATFAIFIYERTAARIVMFNSNAVATVMRIPSGSSATYAVIIQLHHAEPVIGTIARKGHRVFAH